MGRTDRGTSRGYPPGFAWGGMTGGPPEDTPQAMPGGYDPRPPPSPLFLKGWITLYVYSEGHFLHKRTLRSEWSSSVARGGPPEDTPPGFAWGGMTPGLPLAPCS